MKLIYKYVIREFLESAFFGLIVFSSILLLDQIFQLVSLILSKGVSLFIVIKLFLLILPNILSLTIPMAVLFGILLAYGRLSEDNEITALRANGTDFKYFTFPILLLTAALSISLVYFNQYLSPQMHKEFRKIYQEVLTQSPLLKFDEKSIINVGEYKFYVSKVDKTDESLHGVNIYKFSENETGTPWRITASSATVTVKNQNVTFHLFQGYWQKANPARPDNLVHLVFSKYSFTINLGGAISAQTQSLRELTANELRDEMKKYKKDNLPTNFIEIEFWMRFVLAATPFLFALIGIPLGISTEKGGKSIGFGLSILVIFGYYIFLVTGMNIGEKGILPARIVLWLPNMVTLVLGILLWRRMAAK